MAICRWKRPPIKRRGFSFASAFRISNFLSAAVSCLGTAALSFANIDVAVIQQDEV
jgi:hypothetical protein